MRSSRPSDHGRFRLRLQTVPGRARHPEADAGGVTTVWITRHFDINITGSSPVEHHRFSETGDRDPGMRRLEKKKLLNGVRYYCCLGRLPGAVTRKGQNRCARLESVKNPAMLTRWPFLSKETSPSAKDTHSCRIGTDAETSYFLTSRNKIIIRIKLAALIGKVSALGNVGNGVDFHEVCRRREMSQQRQSSGSQSLSELVIRSGIPTETNA